MVDEEVKQLLRQNLELTQENNKLLKKARRARTWGVIFRVLWWAIILGLPFILYFYFLESYVGDIVETYTGFKGGVDSVNQVNNNLPPILQGLFGNLTGQ